MENKVTDSVLNEEMDGYEERSSHDSMDLCWILIQLFFML